MEQRDANFKKDNENMKAKYNTIKISEEGAETHYRFIAKQQMSEARQPSASIMGTQGPEI